MGLTAPTYLLLLLPFLGADLNSDYNDTAPMLPLENPGCDALTISNV
jgi:hypothetical protein